MQEPVANRASFLQVVDTALDRYVARARFYLTSAAVVAAAGSAAILLGNLDSSETYMVAFIGLSLLHGIVAIGTAQQATDERLSIRAIISRVLRRWPELLLCQLLVFFVGSCAIAALVDTSISSAIALIPLCIAWGAVSLCDVAIAIDTPDPSCNMRESIVNRIAFFAGSIATPLGYAFRVHSMSRVALLAVIQLPTVLLLFIIDHQVQLHHVTINEAWIAFLISCLTDGCFEAIFTKTLQRLREA